MRAYCVRSTLFRPFKGEQLAAHAVCTTLSEAGSLLDRISCTAPPTWQFTFLVHLVVQPAIHLAVLHLAVHLETYLAMLHLADHLAACFAVHTQVHMALLTVSTHVHGHSLRFTQPWQPSHQWCTLQFTLKHALQFTLPLTVSTPECYSPDSMGTFAQWSLVHLCSVHTVRCTLQWTVIHFCE